MGAAGSPEKQLTPAPQPRSAWVSARSEVVTAAHRAYGRGEAQSSKSGRRRGRDGSMGDGRRGEGVTQIWMDHPQSERDHGSGKPEEKKRTHVSQKKKASQGGWAEATQLRLGS